MKVNRLAPFSWFKRKGLTPLNRGTLNTYIQTPLWLNSIISGPFSFVRSDLASSAAALFPSPREGTHGEGNKAAALEARSDQPK